MPETAATEVGPSPSGDSVDLWHLDLDAPGAASGAMAALLSAPEQGRASRFHHESGRTRYVACRAALRQILGRLLDEDPATLELEASATGRPFLAGTAHPRFDFNVSHAGAEALIVVAQHRRVGIDIERVRDLTDAASLVERFFAQEERDQFAALPDQAKIRGFFAAWTRKEAFAKATGRGIADTLQRFAVTVDPDAPPSLLRVDWPEDDPGNWTLTDLPPRPDHASALAVEGDGWHLQLHTWEPGLPG